MATITLLTVVTLLAPAPDIKTTTFDDRFLAPADNLNMKI
jgi:hypothetical protein